MTTEEKLIKPVVWIGSSKRDYDAFPDPVQGDMGYAIYRAQIGRMHITAKPLKGFGNAGIVEIVEDHKGSAYRAIYTVRFATAVCVLHAFQKKSHKGIRTDRRDIELVKKRLKNAEELHKQTSKERQHGEKYPQKH